MDNKNLLNVSIIEDSAIHVAWLKTTLSIQPSINILSIDAIGKNGLLSIKKHTPHIVLLDFQLNDLTGLEIAKRIKKHNNHIKIFMLTAHTEMSIIHRIISDTHIDAIGIKSSPYFKEHFLMALFHVHHGQAYLDPSLLSQLRESQFFNNLSALTKREFEIFMQMSMGKKEVKIATDLNIELPHVRNMKSKILKKLKDTKKDFSLSYLYLQTFNQINADIPISLEDANSHVRRTRKMSS